MTKEETRRKFLKECYDEYHNDNQARFIFDWFWSEIESRDGQISELQIANKMYQEDLESRDKRIKELEEQINKQSCTYFIPAMNTTSVTVCSTCGREKWEH